MSKQDGGPAHPVPQHCNFGLTKREWFAAHAPKKPDDWFIDIDKFPKHDESLRLMYCEGCQSGSDCQGTEECLRSQKIAAERDNWFATRPMRWRWAYADAMLKEAAQ